MFGIPIGDLLTYTNVAYLLSLLITFLLTATLWRVSVGYQRESDDQLEKYKVRAEANIAEANAVAATARQEAAVAHERAAKAESETAQAQERISQLNLHILKMQAPRQLTTETAAKIIQACSGLGEIRFDSAINGSDAESLKFVTVLQAVLVHAGWTGVNWTGNTMALTRQGLPSVGDVTSLGVAIQYHVLDSERLAHPAQQLSDALNSIGIVSRAEQVTWKPLHSGGRDMSEGLIHIIVGQKML